MKRVFVVEEGELSFVWSRWDRSSPPKILRDQTGACWEKTGSDEPYARVERSLSVGELSSSTQCWFGKDVRRVAD
jgi:hypothetical protein